MLSAVLAVLSSVQMPICGITQNRICAENKVWEIKLQMSSPLHEHWSYRSDPKTAEFNTKPSANYRFCTH